MVKHLAFWIGFFAAALLIIPIAVGIWGAAEELARNLAVFLFGVISVLVVGLVGLLFFRDRLLRKLLGTAETTLDDVSSALVKTVSAAASGDRATAEKEALALARSASGWYVWSGFYRWVIASALGLLLAFGAFTGTALLFEQTRKLGEQTELMGRQSELMQAQTDRMAEQSAQFQMQNEIMTVSLVSELREQLASTVETITLQDILSQRSLSIKEDAAFIASPDRSCGIGWQLDAELSRPPSRSIVSSIVTLGTDQKISDQIVAALQFLVQDRDSAIAFGAFQALNDLGRTSEYELHQLRFVGLAIEQVRINGSHTVEFEGGYTSDFQCPDCILHFDRAFFEAIGVGHMTTFGSVGFRSTDFLGGEPEIAIAPGFAPDAGDIGDGRSIELSSGPSFFSEYFARIFLMNPRDEDVCTHLQDIAADNRMFRYLQITP